MQQVPHTVKDILTSHVTFQKQWAVWSESHKTLDACIRASLPKDDDLLEAKMTIQPMYATMRERRQNGTDKGGKKGKAQNKGASKGKRAKGQQRWGQQQKGKGKGQKWTSREMSMADRLATATGQTRAQVLGTIKGKSKGKSKGAKGPKGAKGQQQSTGQPRQCIDWLNGTCTRGENCRYSHE